MNRALVWIAAVVLAVGPLANVGMVRPATANQTVAKPVSAYVLMDGPVAASTDDVTATTADEGPAEIGSGGVATSLAWTAAAGVLVLAAWGAVVAGDAVASRSRRTVRGGAGVRRDAARRGWLASSRRYAVPKVARWGTAVRVGE